MQVEHGVPLPADKAPSVRKYDWDQVGVGDSFVFDGQPGAVTSSFGAWMIRGKYRIKKQPDGRYRFWRLA